ASSRASDEDCVRDPCTHRRHFDARDLELEHFAKLERDLIIGSKFGSLTRRESYPLAYTLSFEPGPIIRSECLRGAIKYVSGRHASLHGGGCGLDPRLNPAVCIFLLR